MSEQLASWFRALRSELWISLGIAKQQVAWRFDVCLGHSGFQCDSLRLRSHKCWQDAHNAWIPRRTRDNVADLTRPIQRGCQPKKQSSFWEAWPAPAGRHYNVLFHEKTSAMTIFAPHLSVSARQSWSELCLFCKQLEFLFSAIPLKVVNLRIKCSFLEVYNENATQWQCLEWTMYCFAGTFCPEPEVFDSLNHLTGERSAATRQRFLGHSWRSRERYVCCRLAKSAKMGKAGHSDLFEHAKVAHIWDSRYTCQYMFCATPWERWHAKCPAIQEGKSKQIQLVLMVLWRLKALR